MHEFGAEIALLRNLAARMLPRLDAEMAGAQLYGAPAFNVFKVLRPSEMQLSSILANLLDPAGSHGQGALFLDAFLEVIGLNRADTRDHIRVRCEVWLTDTQRIDILIECRDFVVGIENKPWARQLPRQLQKYRITLEKWARQRQCKLVFLANQNPETDSGDIHHMAFSAPGGHGLVQLLQSVSRNVKANVVSSHISQMISYIQENFEATTMQMSALDIYKNAVVGSFTDRDLRRWIAAIMLSKDALHRQVLSEIAACILHELHNVAVDFVLSGETDLHRALATQWTPWSVRRPCWPTNMKLALEAQANNFRSVAFGVIAPDPNDTSIDENTPRCLERKAVEDALAVFEAGQPSPHWAWYRNLNIGVMDQDFSARIVLDSPTGQVAEHPEIMAIAQKLADLAREIDQAVNS